MKKRVKGLVSGFIVLVVLFGLYFFAVKWTPETEIITTETDDETYYLFKTETDNIASIEFYYDGNSYTVRNGENKTISGYESKIIDPELLTRAIHSFSYIIENQNIKVEDTSLLEYGIKDSSTYVVIKEKDGKSTKIILGNSTGVEGEYYAYNEATGRLSSISKSSAEFFKVDPSQYRSLDVCSIAPETIERVAISRGNNKIIDIEFEKEKKDPSNSIRNYKILYPYKGVVASTDRTNALLETISSITAQEIVTENMNEITSYGFNNPYKLTVTDGNGTHTISLGNKNDDGLVYIMYNDRKVVYLADCPFYEKVVNANSDEYIDRFIHLVNLSDVNSVEFSFQSQTDVISVKGDIQNDKAKYYVNNKDISEENFKKLYQAIIGVIATDIDDDFVPTGKEQCTITFDLNNNQKKTFKYYNYNERNYYVKADNGIGCLTLKKNIDAICDLLK
ncbi:MAG: DUF4340 domain-containing protein [Clostridia bacterium]|nr:DUF4340 domain-containing protein [Clostridia bacterium]